MALQLYADTIERIDILLLETRHIQTNLIYLMRFKQLHRALRFEESYIFGSLFEQTSKQEYTHKSWSIFFKELNQELKREVYSDTSDNWVFKTDYLKRISNLSWHVIPSLPKSNYTETDTVKYSLKDPFDYSNTCKITEGIINPNEIRTEVIAPIAREYKRRYSLGFQEDMSIVYYDIFIAIQNLKREVLYSKLILSFHASRFFAQFENNANSSLLKKETELLLQNFIFFRSIVSENLNIFVERLSDFHAQFEKSLDIGSQDNHRPITGRRQEQGIYNHVLTEVSKESISNATEIIAQLTGKEKIPSILADTPIVIHRWRHHFSSQNHELIKLSKNFSDKSFYDNDTIKNNISTISISSSFWTPDRPDLQPAINHEAAHCAMLHLLGDLSDTFTNDPSSISVAFKKLSELYFQDKDIFVGDYTNHYHAAHFSREIIADIIATYLSGPSYVFALYQELFGYPITNIVLRMKNRDWRDYELMGDLITNGFGASSVSIEWYIRLEIIIDVTDTLFGEVFGENSKACPLQNFMLKGIHECNEALLDFIYKKTQENPISVARAKVRTQKALEIIKNSGLVKDLKKFLSKKQNDKARPEAPGDLDIESLNQLKEYFIERKATNPARKLYLELVRPDNQKLSSHALKEFEGSKLTEYFKKPEGVNSDNIIDAINSDPLSAAQTIYEFNRLHLGGKKSISLKLRILANKIQETDDNDNKRTLLNDMLSELPMFQTLWDIPWQASLMRTCGILAKSTQQNENSKSTQQNENYCIAESLSADFAPGRETIRLGVELWSLNTRNDVDILSECIRHIRTFVKLPSSLSGFDLIQNSKEKMQSQNWGLDNYLFHKNLIQGEDFEKSLKENSIYEELRYNLLGWLGEPINPDFIENSFWHAISLFYSDFCNDSSVLNSTDHPEICEGLALVLRSQKNIEICERLVAAFRVLEVCQLHEAKLENTKTEELGADLLIKLTSSFPWLNFNYGLQESWIFDEKKNKKFLEIYDEFCKSPPAKKDISDDLFKLVKSSKWGEAIEKIVEDFLPEQVSQNKYSNFIFHIATYFLTETIKGCKEANSFDIFLRGIFENDQQQSLDFECCKPEPAQYGHLGSSKYSSIQKAVRSKLTQLSEILQQQELGEHRAKLSPIIQLLKIYNENKSDNIKTIREDFFKGIHNQNHKGLRSFSSLTVARQSLMHTYWWRESHLTGSDKNDLAAFYWQLAKKENNSLLKETTKSVRKFATLGRYDYFYIAPDHAITDLRQAMMDHNLPAKRNELYTNPEHPFSPIKDETIFKSFFERREKAIQVSLHDTALDLLSEDLTFNNTQDKDVINNTQDKDVICFLSVRLGRRSRRIQFVNRLRNAAKNWIDIIENKNKSIPIFDDDNYTNFKEKSKQAFLKNVKIEDNKNILIEELEKLLEQAKENKYSENNNKILKQFLSFIDRNLPERKGDNLGLERYFNLVRNFGDLPEYPLDISGGFIAPEDSVLLGEGWADLTIVMTCDKLGDEISLEQQKRLFDIFALQNILFQDPEVVRTEMFIRPVALPLASISFKEKEDNNIFKDGENIQLKHPSSRFFATLSIRTMEDRQLGGLLHKMSNSIQEYSKKWIEEFNKKQGNQKNNELNLNELRNIIHEKIRIGHIPGRNDLEINFSELYKISEYLKYSFGNNGLASENLSSALQNLHEIIGVNKHDFNAGADEIITRIGFVHPSINKQNVD